LNFLIDMPVTSRAVSRLIAAGHQAVHAASIGLASARDAEILAVARAGRQIIVTADLDYPRLLAIHRAAAPGVILFRGGSYTDDEMLRLLDRVLAQSNPLDLEHSITVVDRARVRRHRLPIDE
jgi:predicted nuclease of predicted toxin-antitoxin system